MFPDICWKKKIMDLFKQVTLLVNALPIHTHLVNQPRPPKKMMTNLQYFTYLPEKGKHKLHTENASQTGLLGHIISRNALHDMTVNRK